MSESTPGAGAPTGAEVEEVLLKLLNADSIDATVVRDALTAAYALAAPRMVREALHAEPDDLWERVQAAQQLGYEVRLLATEDGLIVEYVKRPDSPPWEVVP